MSEVRAFAFRERASQAHNKAMRAGIPEETRRAWLIVERAWTRMAEREELNDAMSWVDGGPQQRSLGQARGEWHAIMVYLIMSCSSVAQARFILIRHRSQ